MNTRMKNALLFSLIGLLFTYCSSSNSNENAENTTTDSTTLSTLEEEATLPENQISEAVCIWDKSSVRETPNPKGKWKTSLNLGEGITYLGKTETDTTSGKTFVKIKLADDMEGWCRTEFIVKGGKAGVFIQETKIYKRPDLLTESKKVFSTMDVVAIQSNEGDWAKVKGKRADGSWIDEGFVLAESLSTDPIDIAVGKEGSKVMSLRIWRISSRVFRKLSIMKIFQVLSLFPNWQK